MCPPSLRRTSLLAAVAAAMAGPLAPGRAGADDRALIVGVNRCNVARFPRLEYCEADAEDLGAYLVQSGFRVTFLTNSRAERGDGPRPDKDKILDRLSSACNDTTGTLIVFLSGHGVSFDGARAGDPRRGCFLPSNADFDDKNGPANFLEIEGEVLKAMERSGAARKFLFVDACRETGNKNLDPPIVFADDDSVTAARTHVLYSCQEGQISKEHRNIGHGVFTYFLLKGLKGKAASDGDTTVSMGDLARYLERNVKAYVKTKLGIDQVPHWKKPDDRSIDVLSFEPPGSRMAVFGEDRPNTTEGLPAERRSIDDVKDRDEYVGVTFTGTFYSDVFAGKRFTNCRFKHCKFTRSVNLARATMIDCKFENANFQQARNTQDVEIYGDRAENLDLIWGEDKVPSHADGG